MNTIVVKSQAEFDALPKAFDEYTVIEIRAAPDFRLIVSGARENSSVVARENSSVAAWENSFVEARENSSVVAWGNSSVEAWGNVGIHNFSTLTSLELFGFSVAWLIAKASKITVRSKNARVITPARGVGVDGWLDNEGVNATANLVILFKRVSNYFKTQEGNKNETSWAPGSVLEHPAWNPGDSECNGGKYHACSRPYFCDEFRDKKGDRYVALRIAVEDLYAWPNPDYPHKIAFRKGTVVHECDRFGREIKR